MNWHDIVSRGYLVIPEFLTSKELLILRQDFERSQTGFSAGESHANPMASPMVMRYFADKQGAVTMELARRTGLTANFLTAGMYFSIRHGVNYNWHQDHESWLIFGEHYHYLNFYIPIIKEDPAHSNLSLIPFDAVQQHCPEFEPLIVGQGARRIETKDGKTRMIDDVTDESQDFPYCLDRMCVTPELREGDALIFRGDIIHRTQDTSTPRVAASFRWQNADTRISIARINQLAGNGNSRNARLFPILKAAQQALSDWHSSHISVRDMMELLRRGAAQGSHIRA